MTGSPYHPADTFPEVLYRLNRVRLDLRLFCSMSERSGRFVAADEVFYSGNLQPSAPASATNADDKHELFNDADATTTPTRSPPPDLPVSNPSSSIHTVRSTLTTDSYFISQFVKEGKFQRQADMVRLQAKFGETEARKIAAREARERRAVAERERLEATADPNLIPLGARAGIKGGMAGAASSRAAFVLDEIPEAEWWDVHILKNGTYDDISDGKWEIKPEKINLYVEHPVPMQPPMEAPPPPPQPLKLTKREQKKLRTQRRQQREQEKQEMIRQGLLEPPKPKVKISNLMRVLTDEATADPTAIEKEVRQQMEERASAHEDRNLARQLTPAERRERKIRKLFDDPTGSVETQVHVYRVESLANPKNKFRVDINAQENRLSGEWCLLFHLGYALMMYFILAFSSPLFPNPLPGSRRQPVTTSREPYVLKASELSAVIEP
jgi:U4/U6 small nuclear ribonucleoprotein PRP3